MTDTSDINIQSRDYWFKIVDFLQQNWALIDAVAENASVRFIGDDSGVFDQMEFESLQEAEQALGRNGFQRFSSHPDAASFLAPPQPPFRRRPHPNGPIYSSGRFWS
jgi:hypothetical protein